MERASLIFGMPLIVAIVITLVRFFQSTDLTIARRAGTAATRRRPINSETGPSSDNPRR